MAGQIIVSNIKTDSDNAFSILANTGAVLFSANLASGITTGIADGSVTTAKIASSVTLTTPIISGNLSLDSTGTTGVRSPAANTLTFHTAGTEDVRITSNGWVGVGTTTPANTFTVKGTGIVAERDVDTDRLITTYNDINVYANATGGTNHNVFTLRQSNNTTSNNRLRVTATGLFQFDSGYGNIATAYGCRAWVHFDGTGTPAIRGSGNVSSITDNGEGDYTINFTNAMPDANYAVAGAARFPADASPTAVRYVGISSGAGFGSVMTTTSVRVVVAYANGALQDPDVATVTIHR